MNAPARARQFTAALAVREQVPLLIGLMGPSGGGKTFSALRLATGVQQVSGGDIYVIDTEARRALHYADNFKFKHVPFDAPFGSLDYLDALRYCVNAGAGVVVIDSMSHEHEGPGGLIDLQDQEMRRLAGDDYGSFRAERFNMLAWQKPKAARRQLINGLLQLNANFIFCFRAKETSKPKTVERDGRKKTEIVPMGFMPIAGDEFVYEMTLNALLLPGARGVPTWRSDNTGERMMMKLPEQFSSLADRNQPLDEQTGHRLAEWARGVHKLPADHQGPATAEGEGQHPPGPPQSADDDGFPGDRSQNDQGTGPAPHSTTAPLTLSQRISAYRKRAKEAPSVVKLKAVRAAAAELRRDIDRADPDEVGTSAELERWTDDLMAELERAEQEGGR